MAQSPLRPQKTAMLVAQQIVADINRRGNTVGDRLPPERVMLDEYSVGRGTLRESLRFLELQGVISLRPGPGGGPIVQQPDATGLTTTLTLLMQFEKAPFRAVSEARTALEPMVARLASERMSGDRLKELKESVDTMGENLADHEVFQEEDRRFHDLIAHGSGNVMFGYLVGSLIGILDGSAVGVDHPQHRRAEVHRAHLGIYEAIASRDPEASAEAMSRHIHEDVRHAEKKSPQALEAPIVWSS